MSARAFSENRSRPMASMVESMGASTLALSISTTSPVFWAVLMSGRSPVVMPAFHLVLKSPQDMVSMLMVTPGLSAMNWSAAAWMASMRAPWVKECQKVISPESSPGSLEAVLAGVLVSAVPPPPPHPARRETERAAARDRDSSFFIFGILLTSLFSSFDYI